MKENTATGTKSRTRAGTPKASPQRRTRGQSNGSEASADGGAAASMQTVQQASKQRVAWFKKQIATATKIGERLNKDAQLQQTFVETLTAEAKAYEAAVEHA